MKKSTFIDIILILILVSLFYGNGFFPKYNFSPSSDALSLLLPSKTFFKETILSGSFPLWNPYKFMGSPFAATALSSVYSPFNYLILLFDLVSTGINYIIFLHLFLAALFMYLYLKYGLNISRGSAIFGGITFCFCGYIGSKLDHTAMIGVMCWIPLSILCFIKLFETGKIKYGILISFVIALQVFAGHPQHLYYNLMFLGFYLIFYFITDKEKTLKYKSKFSIIFFLSILLGIAISSIQILPTLSLADDGLRNYKDFEFNTSYSFPPKQLITFIFPKYFGTLEGYTGEKWFGAFCCYIGLLPLFLIIFSLFLIKKQKVISFYFFMIILFILLATGKHTPVYKIFYYLMPGFKNYRGPEKFILLANILMISLSAIGMDYILEKLKFLKNKSFKIIFIFLCITISFTDLYLFSKNQFFSIPIDIRLLDKPNEASDFLKNNSEGYRIFRLMDEIDYTNYSIQAIFDRYNRIEPDFNFLSHAEDLYGYEEGLLPPLDYILFMKSFHSNFYTMSLDPNLLALMNVKYILADKPIVGDEFKKVLYLHDSDRYSYNIYENKKALPKFNWLDEIDDDYNLPILNYINRFEGDTAIANKEKIDILKENKLKRNNTKNKNLEIYKLSPNEFKIVKDKADDGYIIYSCAYVKGWYAQYNGEKIPIYKLNPIMGRFYAPKDVEEIKIVYSPLSFKYGMWLSIISLILAIYIYYKTRNSNWSI